LALVGPPPPFPYPPTPRPISTILVGKGVSTVFRNVSTPAHCCKSANLAIVVILRSRVIHRVVNEKFPAFLTFLHFNRSEAKPDFNPKKLMANLKV
jgi:hypothetical protein